MMSVKYCVVNVSPSGCWTQENARVGSNVLVSPLPQVNLIVVVQVHVSPPPSYSNCIHMIIVVKVRVLPPLISVLTTQIVHKIVIIKSQKANLGWKKTCKKSSMKMKSQNITVSMKRYICTHS